MRNPDEIRRLTRATAIVKDPPWLPMALWTAGMPALVRAGVVPWEWWLYSLGIAAAITAVSVRRFKRRYGVVTLPADTVRPTLAGGLAVIAVVTGLEGLSTALHVPVRLGLAAFGVWLAYGACTSVGIRRHLYVLAGMCIAMALLPFVAGSAVPNSSFGTLFTTVFGLGWAYVCVEDYRMLRRLSGN